MQIFFVNFYSIKVNEWGKLTESRKKLCQPNFEISNRDSLPLSLDLVYLT